MPKKAGSVGIRPKWVDGVLTFEAVEDKKVIGTSQRFDEIEVEALWDQFRQAGISTVLQQRVSQERAKGWEATFKAMAEYWEIFKAGEWSATREKGARCPAALIAVLMELYEEKGQTVSPEAIQKGWKALDEEAQKALVAKHEVAMKAQAAKLAEAEAVDLLDL